MLRRLAGDDPEVNEEWNCDKGRWAFAHTGQRDRLTSPLIRNIDGSLIQTSWPQALAIASARLFKARGRAGVLVGGRVTLEDAYAYAKFARIALGTNDIDFRARAHSAEEAEFLASRVAGRRMTVTYADLDAAPVVLLVGFEPEEESPIVFLRLRKAARVHGLRVYSIGPFITRGLAKMAGTLLRTRPNEEPAVLDELHTGDLAVLLRQPGAVIMVGERLSAVPGGLSAAARLADATGAHLAWVPRRAGERGAIEAGALPNLLPGGRPASRPGRDTTSILSAAAAGALDALVIGGVEITDLTDPQAARNALSAAPFIVSLELRHSEVTDHADVVLPVASVSEKSGTFLNWEGRQRFFPAIFQESTALADLRVLDSIATEMGTPLGITDSDAAREELRRIGDWGDARPEATSVPARHSTNPVAGQAILAGWRMLLDNGCLQDSESDLAMTARRSVLRLSPLTAAEIGASENERVTVRTARGTVTLPLTITDMPDRVVWLPLNSLGSSVYQQLGVGVGAPVQIGVSQ
ncbi:hypothetical protein A5784_22545 [Mycobacterium sp. 852013-50091_SCH5140682]|nr:hypothetical protein A5784_22545 [Mycobacterium sp. 852013-50091_SCH5140682]